MQCSLFRLVSSSRISVHHSDPVADNASLRLRLNVLRPFERIKTEKYVGVQTH